jgi:hypothetical protein
MARSPAWQTGGNVFKAHYRKKQKTKSIIRSLPQKQTLLEAPVKLYSLYA